jgi:tetraacyldisaccharide 4'-kinase
LKRKRGERETLNQTPLPVPVISVGGITIGGSGKTPFCDYLAAEFRKRGAAPAILTRGYRRLSPANTVLLSPAAHVPSALTGDEAQIFLRSGQATVAIGSDRYVAARTLLAEDSDSNVLLLDDGFQHASMRRDCDIVLIDGLDPFGGDEVFPNGRLREPLEALSRADVFVLTRPGHPERVAAIRARLASCNPTAPLFTAGLVGRAWRQFPSGRSQALPKHSRIAAFCGLGNPQSFWNTLLELEMNVPFQWTFGDHHQYKPVEVQRLVHQARVHCAKFLVTTEKDSINLPPDAETILCGMPLLWLKIELALAEPEAFFSYIDRLLASKAAQ